MNAALAVVLAVDTGVVVIVVAVAVVLVVLIVALSLRGRQMRGAARRDQERHGLAEAQDRTSDAERERDIAERRARRPSDDA